MSIGCSKLTRSSRLPVQGRNCKLSVPTVTSALSHLEKLGVAHETTGRRYARIYAYDKYLKILNEGTEPLD